MLAHAGVRFASERRSVRCLVEEVVTIEDGAPAAAQCHDVVFVVTAVGESAEEPWIDDVVACELPVVAERVGRACGQVLVAIVLGGDGHEGVGAEASGQVALELGELVPEVLHVTGEGGPWQSVRAELKCGGFDPAELRIGEDGGPDHDVSGEGLFDIRAQQVPLDAGVRPEHVARAPALARVETEDAAFGGAWPDHDGWPVIAGSGCGPRCGGSARIRDVASICLSGPYSLVSVC